MPNVETNQVILDRKSLEALSNNPNLYHLRSLLGTFDLNAHRFPIETILLHLAVHGLIYTGVPGTLGMHLHQPVSPRHLLTRVEALLPQVATTEGISEEIVQFCKAEIGPERVILGGLLSGAMHATEDEESQYVYAMLSNTYS